MATRKKKPPEPIQKKFIFVSEAVYINQYVVHANSQEEAFAIWSTIKDNEEEGDLTMVQQLMREEVLDVKEAN